MFDHVQCPGCMGTGLAACSQCSGWSAAGCAACGGSNAVRCHRCEGARRVPGSVLLVASRPNFVERHGGRFFAAGTLLAATATALLLGAHLHI